MAPPHPITGISTPSCQRVNAVLKLNAGSVTISSHPGSLQMLFSNLPDWIRLAQTVGDPAFSMRGTSRRRIWVIKSCWKVPLVAGLWLKHIEAHPWLSMLQLFSAQEFLCECMVNIINTCPSNLKRYGQFEVLLASFIQNHELEQRWKQLQSWSDTSASKNQRRKSKEVVRARHHGSLASLWSLPMAPLPGGPWGTEWWRWRTCKSDQAIFDTASSGEGTY